MQTIQFFFTCISPQYSKEKIKHLSQNVDWDKLLEISIKTRTTPFIFSRIQSLKLSSSIPENIFQNMKKY